MSKLDIFQCTTMKPGHCEMCLNLCQLFVVFYSYSADTQTAKSTIRYSPSCMIFTWQHWKCNDRSGRGSQRMWKTKIVLVGQHHGVDWPVGGQLVAWYMRETMLVSSISQSHVCSQSSLHEEGIVTW